MGRNYLSILKPQRPHRWRLGMDTYFHLTLYWTGDYFSMLGVKLNHDNRPGILTIKFLILYQEQLYIKYSRAEVYWTFQSCSISDYAFYPQSAIESCNLLVSIAVIILRMGSASEERRNCLTSSPIGCAHTQTGHCNLSGNPIITGTEVETP